MPQDAAEIDWYETCFLLLYLQRDGDDNMASCDNCGNDYHASFQISINDATHTFDCFECAIHLLAPSCSTCGTRVIGHGIEAADGEIYCCAHCAAGDGVTEAVDHVRS